MSAEPGPVSPPWLGDIGVGVDSPPGDAVSPVSPPTSWGDTEGLASPSAAGISEPSTALVHVPRAEFFAGRRERRLARRARRRRLAAWGSVGLAGGALALLAFLPVPQGSPPLAGAVDAALVTTTTALPPQGVSTLPEPRAVSTTSTVLPWVVVPVETPGWRGDGRLVTDGERAPRVFPGERGRSVVVAPVDPTSAATINVGGRQWRVMTRGVIAVDQLGELVGPAPAVPTVALVSSLGGATRPWIEAR